MATTITVPTQADAFLRKRLLNDIAELQAIPYPGIKLHTRDEDALQEACLILSPEDEAPLHLTVSFKNDYPLSPPNLTIQSNIRHPNVFDSYICASILNTSEGYTSAYTLKGVCIQLLSFFSDDKIEQQHGGGQVSRKKWAKEQNKAWAHHGFEILTLFTCRRCGFSDDNPQDHSADGQDVQMTSFPPKVDDRPSNEDASLFRMPPEIILNIADFLDDQELFIAAAGWSGLAAVIQQYNVLRSRELQCFTLKQSFLHASLGVGVTVTGKLLESEFDLVSEFAFSHLAVRSSIQGVPFSYWLPLPISRAHWLRVRGNVDERLGVIANAANMKGSMITVLYAFMSDIAVRLSKDANDVESAREIPKHRAVTEQKSTLRVVSEKAIESYFHLLHLLLCLAAERPNIVQQADEVIKSFVDGKTNKNSVPNLGHLLVMVLISSKDITEPLTKAIIKEAITRNVVWMLDPKGQNHPELSYLETDPISDYRLQKTFDASKTSYRLLMFANLMRKEVVTMSSVHGRRMTLEQLQGELFTRHGAPPNNAASRLAVSVKHIQNVSSFPEFLKAMDISHIPSASEFTAFLRRTVEDSMHKGYSRAALTQPQAFTLRVRVEPDVGRGNDMGPWEGYYDCSSRVSFFPNKRKR